MIQRRQLLRLSAAGLGIGTLGPAWLATAFAAERDPSQPDRLAAAFAQARRNGKPLLVLIVPESAEVRAARGTSFGGVFEAGTEDLWAAMALTEVMCAPIAAVRRQFPTLRVDGEPFWILLETESQPRHFQFAPAPEPFEPSDDVSRAVLRDELVAWARPNGARLVAALRGSVEQLASRARQTRAALGPEASLIGLAAVENVRGKPDNHAVDKIAALLLASNKPLAKWQESKDTLLAKAARARVFDNSPSGGRWTISVGCGRHSLEHEREALQLRMACGRGHLPRGARRFLELYIDAKPDTATDSPPRGH